MGRSYNINLPRDGWATRTVGVRANAALPVKGMRRVFSWVLLPLLLSCGQETRNHSASAAGACGAGNGCEPDGSVGLAGEGAGGACTDPGASTPSQWASWPMPHPQASALPNPASYDARLNGVVLDRVTGLMWQREASAPNAFAEAEAGCSALELAGFCDWRLPTRIELVSLVDFTRDAPAFDPLFSGVNGGELWSTSLFNSNRWRIGVDGATRASSDVMAPSASARCVRVQTPHASPEVQYDVGGQSPNDWVKDHGTGLTWQRHLGTGTFSFAEAKTHCANWGDGGFRVPSMKELQTLVDESKSESPLIDSEAFPDVPTTMSVTFWTSTSSANRPSHAWFLRGATMLDVAVDADLDAKFYVRCVR